MLREGRVQSAVNEMPGTCGSAHVIVRTLWMIAVVCCVFGLSPTLHGEEGGAATVAWKPEQRDIEIPMRDGKALIADLYLPPKPGRYPAILIQTPYNKKHLDAPISNLDEKTGETGRGAVSDIIRMLDREHYVYAVVDWRGFYASKTAMEGVTKGKWRRGQDGFDCVEWLAAQRFSDGKVGTWGGSALGKQQFDTALEHPPHLVCCVPLIASMGQSYSMFYENGALLEAHTKTLDLLGYGVSQIVLKFPKPDALAWKAAERLTYKPGEIEVPCLMISGWWDNYPDDVVRTFEDLVAKGGVKCKEHSKLMLGPWDHVSVGVAKQGDLAFEGAAKSTADAAKAYFDHWLRGVENGWEKTPRVRYWAANEEVWREAESWSRIPRDTKSLYLRTDGTLQAEKGSGMRNYKHDPRDAAPTLGGSNLPPLKHGPTNHAALDARKDTLAYTTAPLDEPLRVNGKVELTFEYSVNRESCDFLARLCEVREDGKPYLVSDAVTRQWSVKTGEKTRATLSFPLTAYTFLKGHALRVYVGSANWPRYERNPHTGADHWDEKSALDLDVTIHHEGAKLSLPLLKP